MGVRLAEVVAYGVGVQADRVDAEGDWYSILVKRRGNEISKLGSDWLEGKRDWIWNVGDGRLDRVRR